MNRICTTKQGLLWWLFYINEQGITKENDA